jgi:hypothetical protein
MGRLSKMKGKRNEQVLAKVLREELPQLAHKITREGWLQVDDPDAPDVNLGGVFHIECKHGQRPNVLRALEQAESHCPEHKFPVSQCRWNGQSVGQSLVTMRLNDWLVWLREWVLETET